jgi:hypothetical protein
MNFIELKKKVGLPLAFLIADSKAPVKEWKKLSFKDCYDIVREAKSCYDWKASDQKKEVHKKALTRMESIGTFKNWLGIYEAGGSQAEWALGMAERRAKTFDEWKKIYDTTEQLPSHRSMALGMLQELSR